MQIDLDYMRKMLKPFLESEDAYITAEDWEKAGITTWSTSKTNKLDDKFIFHVSLLVENGFISNPNLESSLSAIGIKIAYRGDIYTYPSMRLTQQGHDFAKLLNQSEILERLKQNFKEYPLKVLFEAGKELSTALMKKKLKELTE